jgi:YegS/Rv2252/BmrU family lipid kinase
MNNMQDRNYLVIINPRSGKGTEGNTSVEIRKFLEENGANCKIKITEKRGDAEEFAKKGAQDGFTHIISMGGDGTSSEIVNAILDFDVVFSVIPNGSGNDFPRALGIPCDFVPALKNIVFGREINVDIGKFRDRYFINGLGIGLDGAVAKRFKKLKIFGGFAGYLIGAVIEAFKFKGFNAKVSSNGEIYENSFILLGASNGPTQGGIRLAPGASVCDNLLDIHLIENMNFFKRLLTLSRVLNAEHVGMEGVNILKVEKIELAVDTTLPAHMDGETFELEMGVYNINILKNKIKVLVPS